MHVVILFRTFFDFSQTAAQIYLIILHVDVPWLDPYQVGFFFSNQGAIPIFLGIMDNFFNIYITTDQKVFGLESTQGT